MGFDRERVLSLRTAAVSVAGELDRVRVDDVEAHAHRVTVRSAASMLNDHWIPFIDGLLTCRAMEGYAPVYDPATLTDLRAATFGSLAAARGWQLFTDEFAARPEPMTVERSTALATAISNRDPAGRMTAADIEFLCDQLRAISASPATVDAFVTTMSVSGWATLCDQLGERRRSLVDHAVAVNSTVDVGESGQWAPIDAAFARVGEILRDAGTRRCYDINAILDSSDPYGAALLVSNLGLAAEQLAAVSRRLIERDRERESTYWGPRAADILMAAMIDAPGAATAFLLQAADDLSLVLWTAWDPGVAGELVRTGVARSTMSLPDARVALPPLVSFMLDHAESGLYPQYNPWLGLLAADVVATWIEHFTVSHPEPIDLPPGDDDALIDLIVDFPSALDPLRDAANALIYDRAQIVVTGAHDDTWRAALSDISAVQSFVENLVRVGAIRRVERDQSEWDLLWSGLNGVSEAVPVPLVGPALGLLQTGLEGAGLGPDVDGVRISTTVSLEFVRATTAASLVCARFDALALAGVIEGDDPPPLPDPDAERPGAEYMAAMRTWLERNDFGSEIEGTFNEIKASMLNEGQVEQTSIHVSTKQA